MNSILPTATALVGGNSPGRVPPHLAGATLNLKGRTMNCTICDRPATYAGVFHPDDPQSFGAPEGRVRTFHYRLCGRCAAAPDVYERIERLIEIGFAAGPSPG